MDLFTEFILNGREGGNLTYEYLNEYQVLAT